MIPRNIATAEITIPANNITAELDVVTGFVVAVANAVATPVTGNCCNWRR